MTTADDVFNAQRFATDMVRKRTAELQAAGMSKNDAVTTATREVSLPNIPTEELDRLVRGFKAQGMNHNDALFRATKILIAGGEKTGPEATIQRYLAAPPGRPADMVQRRAPVELVSKLGADAFSFVASTEDVDGHGTIVRQDWDLSRFAANPVVLWNHDAAHPIGVAQAHVDSTRNLVADVTFAKGDELAERVANLVAQKVVRGMSVGFRSGAVTEEKVNGRNVTVFSKNVLFELSLTPVPSNAGALARLGDHHANDPDRPPRRRPRDPEARPTRLRRQPDAHGLEGRHGRP